MAARYPATIERLRDASANIALTIGSLEAGDDIAEITEAILALYRAHEEVNNALVLVRGQDEKASR